MFGSRGISGGGKRKPLEDILPILQRELELKSLFFLAAFTDWSEFGAISFLQYTLPTFVFGRIGMPTKPIACNSSPANTPK